MAGTTTIAETIRAIQAAQKATAAASELASGETALASSASRSPEAEAGGSEEAATSTAPAPIRVGDVDLGPLNLPADTRQKLAEIDLLVRAHPELEQQVESLKADLSQLSGKVKQAEMWEKLLTNDPVLYQKVEEHLRPGNTGKKNAFPENFAELSAEEQAEHMAQISGRAAADILSPQIEELRSELRAMKDEARLADEVAKDYPETVDLGARIEAGTASPEERALASAWKKALEDNPSLTPKLAYEIVLGRQSKTLRSQLKETKAAQGRSAAAVQKPGPGRDTEETFDVRSAKYRNPEERLRAAADFALRRIRSA